MYKALYLPPAITDIFDIEAYLSEFSFAAADRFAKAIAQSVSTLTELPLIGPAYERDPFFRKMVLDDYLLFYSVDDKRQQIVVHRIFHHSREIAQHMQEYQTPQAQNPIHCQ